MPTPDELLRVLGRSVLPAPELRQRLSISPATLSRLVAQSGDLIVRLGRARATAYARPRPLPEIGWYTPIHRIGEDGRPRRHGEAIFLASGGTWIADEDGRGELFVGLPPWANDMAPQGYLGRSFAARFSELRLPPRVADWSDDHRLVALARRGEDCIGDLILGTESLDRWLTTNPQRVTRSDYPALAREAAVSPAGSSAGGEHPKFPAHVGQDHVLVKFVPSGSAESVTRWRDLLACERLALDTIRRAGIEAAHAEVVDLEGQRFLEVRRFDRVGPRGRRGLVSLGAMSLELYGDLDSWTLAALRLERDRRLSSQDARRIRWLDTFGQLVGNTDRHFWNISLLTGEGGLRLAPAYDVLPMLFAPTDTGLPERTFEPSPPSANSLDVWRDAAEHAESFWSTVAREPLVSEDFRKIATDSRQRVAAASERFRHLL
jgi:HipA-like protein